MSFYVSPLLFRRKAGRRLCDRSKVKNFKVGVCMRNEWKHPPRYSQKLIVIIMQA
jgi:hypothetical protein